ncbi:MAG: hypothetical protein ACREH4_05765 [Vitreimonas sp.]
MTRLLIAFVLAAAACTPAERSPPPGAAQEEPALLVAPATRTVLSGEQAMALARQCSRISPGLVESTWTPSAAELDALDNALAAYLAQRLEQAGSTASPGEYYRQAAGFVIGGRRVIYVNGVHSGAVERVNPNHPFDWRTQAHMICDGGAITFGVEYDPATSQLSNFAFNGSVG